MKQQFRFLYNGSWTKWYDRDIEDLPDLKGLELETVEVKEQLTKAEYDQYCKDVRLLHGE